MSISRASIFLLALGLLVSSQVYGQQKITVGTFYYSGDYDREENTSFSFVPVVWSYKVKPWKFKISSGWVLVDGPGDIGGDSLVSDSSSVRGDRERGLGDLRLAATYQFKKPLPGRVWVDAELVWKLPMADESKGLGTGEEDQKLKLDFIKSFSQVYGFLTLSYNRRGEPDGLSLRNVRGLSLGFSQSIDRGRAWGMFYDFRTASRSENNDIQEISLFYSLPVDKQWKVSSFALMGLNNSSAKYGLGFQATHDF